MIWFGSSHALAQQHRLSLSLFASFFLSSTWWNHYFLFQSFDGSKLCVILDDWFGNCWTPPDATHTHTHRSPLCAVFSLLHGGLYTRPLFSFPSSGRLEPIIKTRHEKWSDFFSSPFSLFLLRVLHFVWMSDGSSIVFDIILLLCWIESVILSTYVCFCPFWYLTYRCNCCAGAQTIPRWVPLLFSCVALVSDYS